MIKSCSNLNYQKPIKNVRQISSYIKQVRITVYFGLAYFLKRNPILLKSWENMIQWKCEAHGY